MTANPERLRRLLGKPELERLVARLRRRLQRGPPLTGTLRLAAASDGERRAVESLLGRAVGRGAGLSVDLDALQAVLRGAEAAPDLRTAVETLTGPVTDLRAQAQNLDARWSRVWTRAAADAAARGAEQWLAELRETGLLRRLAQSPADASALLVDTWHVADALPVRGMALSTLAAECLGDAHALDAGRPLATLLRRLLCHHNPDLDSEEWDAHALWACAGIRIGGGITSTVVVLNLPADPDTATGQCLRTLAARGEPAYLTLRQLLDDSPRWPVGGRRIHVCENVAVLAEAAERLGRDSAPLVVTDGQPSAAAVILLRALGAGGARLYYHGDFDWGGLRIANRIIGRLGALPWRLDSETYRALVRQHRGRPLKGRPTQAVWDSQLAPLMAETGVAIDEERVVTTLMSDLAATQS